jgi:DNA-binding NarL/FixJ family response regulator
MMAEARDHPEREVASRVLIIDDSAAVRQGLRALLDTDASLRTVGEASNATEGLALARTLSPDLILLDNEMPGMNGIELLPALRRELPGTHVVMFTLSPAISAEARARGASAVVSKDGGDATLLDTLREVRRGDRSTTVRLATVARLRRDRPQLSDLLAAFSRRHADRLLGETIGASVGPDVVVRRIRSALRCDAAVLFALSKAGRGVRVVSIAGITDFDDERTFLGLPALARSVREARIVETTSSDDLVAGARSAAFAPMISADGTPLGVVAVFYGEKVALTHPDHRRLRVAAIAAEAAIESAR